MWNVSQCTNKRKRQWTHVPTSLQLTFVAQITSWCNLSLRLLQVMTQKAFILNRGLVAVTAPHILISTESCIYLTVFRVSPWLISLHNATLCLLWICFNFSPSNYCSSSCFASQISILSQYWAQWRLFCVMQILGCEKCLFWWFVLHFSSGLRDVPRNSIFNFPNLFSPWRSLFNSIQFKILY